VPFATNQCWQNSTGQRTVREEFTCWLQLKNTAYWIALVNVMHDAGLHKTSRRDGMVQDSRRNPLGRDPRRIVLRPRRCAFCPRRDQDETLVHLETVTSCVAYSIKWRTLVSGHETIILLRNARSLPIWSASFKTTFGDNRVKSLCTTGVLNPWGTTPESQAAKIHEVISNQYIGSFKKLWCVRVW